MSHVRLSKRVEKSLGKLPHHIIVNLYEWIFEIREKGIDEVRKLPGYHDEPLKGAWKGYRSIRLNRPYRAIYIEGSSDIRLITVVEVNKHEY